jgi:hypothetical protein
MVQAPPKYEPVLNLQTVKAVGLGRWCYAYWDEGEA